MSEEAGPSRHTPLDGLKPRDFCEKWPNGNVTVPSGFARVKMTQPQRDAWLKGVRYLQRLALDYEHYLRWRGISQERLAAQLKVSSNRLSAFRTGKGWPSGPLVAVLRTTIPPQKYMLEHMPDGTPLK